MAQPGVSMRLEGADELARALDALSPRVSGRLQREALEDAAEPLRREMSRLAPRGPGRVHLADHMIVSTARQTENREGGVWVGPSKPFFYAKFLENGTVKMRARPFMRPAFDLMAPESVRMLQRSLWILLAARGI